MIIRHLWQLKTIVFMHWCLLCAVSIGKRKIFKDKQADGCADRYNDGTLMESHEYVSNA